mgnify:FL=1
MDANKTMDLIPEEFETLEASAEFWDTHSLADYWDQTATVHFDVELQRRVFLVPLEWSLANRLMAAARRQGLTAETLANLWLNEHLQQVA